MAVGDVTIVTFSAGEDVTTTAALIKTLSIGPNDNVIQWQHSNQVYIARVEQA